MSEVNSPDNAVTVKIPRNALLAGGGVALVGLGLAAGLMLRSPSTPNGAPAALTEQAAAQASGPEAAANTQPGAMMAAETPQQAPAGKASQRAQRDTHAAAGGATERHSAGASNGAISPDVEARPATVCATCGVIEAVRPVQQKGQGTGLGAVAGGVLGGVVGNQMGKGSGKTAMTVLGAIGGGYAGNEVEKQQRTVTVYEVRVRMDDGSLRTFTQSTEPVPGTRVEVEGRSFRAVDAGGAGNGRPATVQTSGSGGI